MNRVFRCYTEKKPGFDVEARSVLTELKEILGIKGLNHLRLFCGYDVEGIDEAEYLNARVTIFSEPQCDFCYDEKLPDFDGAYRILAVEALPGQFDQRADSCSQCIQIMTGKDRPRVKTALLYVLFGDISDEDNTRIKNYLINPVETREASLAKPETLKEDYPVPDKVESINGFIRMDEKELDNLRDKLGLAMDSGDIKMLRDYFKDEENRDPTITEIRMIDTYWSDHCRHTTFNTHIDKVDIKDERVLRAYDKYLDARRELFGEKADTRPVTLMDIATCAVRLLKKRGVLTALDESDEINACSIKVRANIDGKPQDWLVMFKNETHNHPTEIEPFGGAATCLGGAIRDPLSGRSYVYQAMRVTGSGDPRVPVSETLPGKLPQRKITTTAAAGYSSYGNQIGLATGIVHELYHPGYIAKRMEIGAVVGAAPAENVRREKPEAGDVVILLGGRTGRDGCGGATGSSKVHTTESLETCGSEVQKGNPPEERKIQRLFRNPRITRMIKRCNDFGAGGVSVAIGELADGVHIYLDRVLKKYEGLDGTELAISESQERMAVVVAERDADAFIKAAYGENLEAVIVASVTDEPRLKMELDGALIVDISRAFLNSNGAMKYAAVEVLKAEFSEETEKPPFSELFINTARDLNVASQRGLGERFDSTIGAASVLHPFGGVYQETPEQVMAAKLPVSGETDTCSVMSFGFDPYKTEKDIYRGASLAVVESVSKLVSAGCDYKNAYLSLQEYFERLRNDPKRWGKPFAALLGAFNAQVELKIAAIGGKDSMSGSFMDLDVPPTLVSFALCAEKTYNIRSSAFKAAGNPVYLFIADGDIDSDINYEGIKKNWDRYLKLCREGAVSAGRALTNGGVAGAVIKMCAGNKIGFEFDINLDPDILYKEYPGAIIAECAIEGIDAVCLGRTAERQSISYKECEIPLDTLLSEWRGVLEKVFPTDAGAGDAPRFEYRAGEKKYAVGRISRPKAVIPVFPGTNCEYDTGRAVIRAGGDAECVIVSNLNSGALNESVERMVKAIESAQMLIIPGGFSGGDEPDGSGKFIAAFFRNPRLRDAVHELIGKRDGLVLGICNGFQALIKLGLVPFGEIRQAESDSPTLTYNLIGRHQSRYAFTRVCSDKSPWLNMCKAGEVYTIPMSHGEGRFVATDELIKILAANGQIATQYVDISGSPSMKTEFNPSGSVCAIEGITSFDGRVFGKMGHSERCGRDVGINIFGNKHQPVFESGVRYYNY
ncbi:MAG: phosphoribosylformylglycinamidine synthase [Clostridiales bacterium]|nr:phosphoribosylformylglycinamidine synthase [Clostridiales bacterium]